MLLNIDIKSPQFKKSIEKHINSSSTILEDELNSPTLIRKSPITKATSSEMDIFFENLMKSDKKPAILWIHPGYAEKFRPKSLDTPRKSLIRFLFKYAFQDLQKKCNEIFKSISISQDEALDIESQTRSKSQIWYELRAEHRAGRITASVMKEACRTNLDIPSLIKKIKIKKKLKKIVIVLNC